MLQRTRLQIDQWQQQCRRRAATVPQCSVEEREMSDYIQIILLMLTTHAHTTGYRQFQAALNHKNQMGQGDLPQLFQCVDRLLVVGCISSVV